jgi:hypothetical protein
LHNRLITDVRFCVAQPCDDAGYDLPDDAPPLPEENRAHGDYFPYSSRSEFELADFLFRKDQMAGKKVSELMDIWAAHYQGLTGAQGDSDSELDPPFASAQDLYNKIDSTDIGATPWQAFSVQFDANAEEGAGLPSWKTKLYEVWFRDPLKIAEGHIGNKDFAREMDYSPKRVFSRAGRRQYSDFMSGNWAWDQAVSYVCTTIFGHTLTPQLQNIIARDRDTHGSMFVPIILGSDKTTVSVATGHNEYYPLYASIGNVQNQVRRAHRNAVSILGFLAVPKGEFPLNNII